MRRLVGMVVLVLCLLFAGSAYAAAPTYVGSAQVTSWTTTSSSKTFSLYVNAGDKLVGYGATEDATVPESISAPGITWTQAQQVNVSGYAREYIWTATAATSGSLMITCSSSAGAAYGCGAVDYSHSDGFGASAKANSSGAPSLNLTTTQANSAIVVGSSDWLALDGTSRTWRTGAGAASELTYARGSADYTVYAAQHPDAGAAGAKTVGLSAPGGQKYSIAAVEVKGSTATVPPPIPAFSYTPTNPAAGQTVTFDGGNSACNGGESGCSSYTWTDLGPDGQGGTDYPLGTGITLNFTFQNPGTKYVQLTVTNADGTARSIEHDVVVSDGGTPTPTPTPTPTVTPTPTPTPPPPSDCLASDGCYPKPVNSGAGATGIPPGHSATNSCSTSPSSGAVLDDCSFDGSVTITTTGSGATYRFSRFRGQVFHQGSGTLRVESSEFGPDSGCQTYDNSFVGANYTVVGSRFNSHVSEGPRDSDDNITIQDNFIGPMCSNPGDHADGVQGYFGGNNVHILHNTIDERTAQDVTSPIFIADSSQMADVEDNLLMGGGFTLREHDDFTPDHGPWLELRNRIVDGAWSFGPMDNDGTTFTPETCQDNRLVNIDGSYNITAVGAVVGC